MDISQREAGDRLAILDIVARYAQSVDKFDASACVALFTEDGKFELHGGHEVISGQDELKPFFERAFEWSNGGGEMHCMTDTTIDIDGDSAHVETAATSYIQRVPGKVSVRGIRYIDTMVRTDAGWKIAVRSHNVFWQFDVPSTSVDIVARTGNE